MCIRDSPREVKRGDEIGIFHLGSTAVVFFEPGVSPLTIQPGPVRYGTPITAPARRGSSPADGPASGVREGERA